MKSIIGRSVSAIALVSALAGAGHAQQAPEQVAPPADAALPADRPAVDRVVVTGSNIVGAAEDAALPVEVYTTEDLEKTGEPNAMEFLKSLSIQGDTGGVTTFLGGGGTGVSNFNLRGLGAGRTLTLLNGRRVADNATNIPNSAVERLEILKDGAAVIYGADATGGVVNFITRKSYEGLQLQGSYRSIDAMDGEYNLSALGGFGNDTSNLMVAFEFEHRERLETEDREFSSMPYAINPAPWSTSGNPTAYRFATGPQPGTETAANQFGTLLTPVTATIGDFDDASCAALGGVPTPQPTRRCTFGYAGSYNLSEPVDVYRGLVQYNSALNDNTDFHIDLTYSQRVVPQSWSSPSYPVLRGPAIATGAANQFYVPNTNPYYADFITQNGLAAPPTARGVVIAAYRPWAFGGDPYFASLGSKGAQVTSSDTQTWRISTGLKGEFSKDGFLGGLIGGLNYDFATTYSQALGFTQGADILGFRLQEALSGFGGPGCNAPDLDPTKLGTQNPAAAGKSGCLWFNPFGSSFAANSQSGAVNPRYIAGHENSVELAEWISDKRKTDSNDTSLTFDAVFSGVTPLTLPGGDVGWALGGQWRQIEARTVTSAPYLDGSTPCEWPNQVPRQPTDPAFNGCTPDRPGPFIFTATNPSTSLDRQQYSLFGELSVPVLDNVSAQLAVRREEFSGGLGATVYKVSGKWDITENLGVRASYGTNYQAPPIDLVPGRITNAFGSITAANSTFIATQITTATGIVPETANVANAGVIWSSDGFAPDTTLRVMVDYFSMEIFDEVATAATNGIASTVINGAISPNGSRYANCASPLRAFVEFNNGDVCTQGVTTGLDLGLVKSVRTNGPGLETNGLDIQVDYSMPFMGGDLNLGLNATNILKYEVGGFSFGGLAIQASYDALGYYNSSRSAGAVPELKASLFGNYSIGGHNARLVFNYTSAVEDERGRQTLCCNLGTTNWGVGGRDWFKADAHYAYEFDTGLRLTASVLNILDTDPPPHITEFGYYAGLGDPYGRVIEVGVRKEF